MLATPISPAVVSLPKAGFKCRISPWLLLLAFILMWQTAGQSQNPPGETAAREVFLRARADYQSNNRDASAACGLAKAAFDLAEFVKDDGHRDEIAQVGIGASRQAIDLDPTSAAGYYYLALNLGQLARTKKFRALKILPEMESALLKAAGMDPAYDWAGPDRSLGMLYLAAPGWPTSIGNRQKARKHLEAAVWLSPDFPENRIALLEAYAKWNEPKNLEREIHALIDILPVARDRFSGQQWSANWIDWNRRIAESREALERISTHPPLSSSERGAKSR
jgi:tetratricopeptide (TPR) repeat protein